jgi:hypothetical protein
MVQVESVEIELKTDFGLWLFCADRLKQQVTGMQLAICSRFFLRQIPGVKK